MKELFDLLSQKERKILGLLCLFFAVALLFYFLFALGERGRYFRSLDSLSAKKKNFQKINQSKTQKENEWLRWEEAHRDMNELKTEYFYSEDMVVHQLRRDIQQIFDDIGIRVPALNYEYTEFENEKIKKIKVSFTMTTSYFSLKRFIDSVERFPKFLVIEKVDFLDTNDRGGFRLNIALAGYYES